MVLISCALLSIFEYSVSFAFYFFVIHAAYAWAGNIGSSLSATDSLDLINVGSSSPAAANGAGIPTK